MLVLVDMQMALISEPTTPEPHQPFSAFAKGKGRLAVRA